MHGALTMMRFLSSKRSLWPMDPRFRGGDEEKIAKSTTERSVYAIGHGFGRPALTRAFPHPDLPPQAGEGEA